MPGELLLSSTLKKLQKGLVLGNIIEKNEGWFKIFAHHCKCSLIPMYLPFFFCLAENNHYSCNQQIISGGSNMAQR